MNLTAPLCAPGRLYARGRRRVCVVSADGYSALVAPVLVRNLPRMRGDVIVTDVAELSEMGLPGGSWMIRTCRAQVVELFAASSFGVVPPRIMCEVDAHYRQALASVVVEARMSLTRDLAMV